MTHDRSAMQGNGGSGRMCAHLQVEGGDDVVNLASVTDEIECAARKPVHYGIGVAASAICQSSDATSPAPNHAKGLSCQTSPTQHRNRAAVAAGELGCHKSDWCALFYRGV